MKLDGKGDLVAMLALDIDGQERQDIPADELNAWLADMDRERLIVQAREVDADAFDMEAAYNGPGRYEGADDKALVVALDILSLEGAADDVAGSVENGLYGARIGRFLLTVDAQGFRTAETYAHPMIAADELHKLDGPAECEGHPAGPFDPMGETVYCDGSCRN